MGWVFGLLAIMALPVLYAIFTALADVWLWRETPPFRNAGQRGGNEAPSGESTDSAYPVVNRPDTDCRAD